MKRILIPLSLGFRLGVTIRAAAYRRGWLKTQRLNRPVISVGNLTTGGTGKTPLVAFLAETLLKHGWKPAILTRGYGRRSGNDLLCIAPAPQRTPDPREVGDEPALLARQLPQVPIVVCADRYRAGREAEERFNVDVHVLDDGFQHLMLARDLDIVTLDTTQEVFDYALLPAGPLREPLSALERAHVVVLTRAGLGDAWALEDQVRRRNPHAVPIPSVTEFCGLLNISTSERYSAEAWRGKKVFAFAGIGNSRAFFANLEMWGFLLAGRAPFRDHHVYGLEEIRRLNTRAQAVGAEALVTTEKDALNFPLPWKAHLPVFACVTRIKLRDEESFEDVLFSRLQATRVKT